MNLNEAVARLGHVILDKGHLDSVWILHHGSDERISSSDRDYVDSDIQAAGLSLHTVSGTVPYVGKERFRLLTKMAKDFGVRHELFVD